jgi:hypothetical protein
VIQLKFLSQMQVSTAPPEDIVLNCTICGLTLCDYSTRSLEELVNLAIVHLNRKHEHDISIEVNSET